MGYAELMKLLKSMEYHSKVDKSYQDRDDKRLFYVGINNIEDRTTLMVKTIAEGKKCDTVFYHYCLAYF